MMHAKPIKTSTKQQVNEMAADWEPSKINPVWRIGYALLGISVFGIFAALSQPDRGVVAGFSIGAIVLSAHIRWDLHNRAWFWCTIGAIFLIHAVLVYAWGWRITVKPTILLAPLALVDFIIVISVIFFVERSLMTQGK